MNNRTNPEEENFTKFGRLAPGGLYVHSTKDLVYLFTDVYSDLLELDLDTGKYTYLNNLTRLQRMESGPMTGIDYRVELVFYSEEMDDLIMMTHHDLMKRDPSEGMIDTPNACVKCIYLDEEEDILYAIQAISSCIQVQDLYLPGLRDRRGDFS